MARLETVEINRNGQRVVINKRDFDADEHKLWGDEADKPDVVDDQTISMEDRQYLELVEEYKKRFDKPPHHKMKADSIRKALDKGND